MMVSRLAQKVLESIRRRGFVSRELLAKELGVSVVRIDAALEELRIAGHISYMSLKCDGGCGKCPLQPVCGSPSPGTHTFIVVKKGLGSRPGRH